MAFVSDRKRVGSLLTVTSPEFSHPLSVHVSSHLNLTGLSRPTTYSCLFCSMGKGHVLLWQRQSRKEGSEKLAFHASSHPGTQGMA